jgi:histone H2A
VKYQEQTSLIPIESGVQQGSVLGRVLYLLYTADMPTLRQTTVATFTDDTAVLASHSDPKIASNLLQKNLDKIRNWLKIWRIKVNENPFM